MLSQTQVAEQDAEPQTLRIGQLATLAAVNVETLRFYEREGLLERPYQHLSGYRAYPLATLEVVQTIKRAQALGFKLAEIRDLLHEARAGRVSERAAQKLEEMDTTIARLVQARQELARLVEYRCDRLIGCSCGQADCPIIEALPGSYIEDASHLSSLPPVGATGIGLLAGGVAAVACAACCAPLVGGLLAAVGLPALAIGAGLKAGVGAAAVAGTGLGISMFRKRRRRRLAMETK